MNRLARIICLPIMLVFQACLVVLFAGHCLYAVYEWLVEP